MTTIVRKLFLVAALLLIGDSAAQGQSVALAMASGTTTPGGSAVLAVSMTASGGAQPAALQWTFSYSGADIAAATVAAGPAATAGGKDVQCQNGGGSMTCLVFGMNTTTIGNGVVANITFQTAASTPNSASSISMTGVVASTGSGTGIVATGSGGTITLVQPVALSGLSCSPSTVAPSATSSCTVTLTGAAPAGGLNVTLASNNTNVTVPGSVTVAAGVSTGTFTANVAGVSTDQSATITASRSGVTRTAVVTVAVSAQLSGLSCAPQALGAGAAATCTVTLTKPSSSPAVISVSRNNTSLTVPASISIAAGSTTGTFTVTAGTVTSDQTATVTAAFNGQTQSSTVTLTAAAQVASLNCTPATILSGGASTCVIALTKVAPAGGAAIALTRDDPVITIPASVTVAAGAAGGTFTAAAGAVTSNKSALITASYNGSSQSAAVSVTTQVAVASLICTPATVSSGGSSACTVTLTRGPSAAAVVALASSSAAVAVPSSVTIPAGATSAAFTAAASAVSSDQSGSISASYNGSSQSTLVTVSAPARIASLSCTPAAIASGASAACTVSLTTSAPTGGATIGLTRNNAVVTMPSTISIAAGAASAAFTASATTTTSDQTATITASWNGSSQVTSLIVTAGAPPPSGAALRFVPVTPCRVVDTRNPAGPLGAPSMAADSARSFAIPSGPCGIPAAAKAYALNVTVVPHGMLGYLSIWPAGQTRPLVSTLNSLDGRIKANAAIVPAGTGGAVSVYVQHAADVILDINGYFVPATDASALSFYPLTPCRVADTRETTRGLLGAPSLTGGVTRTLPVLSSGCYVPASARAYSLNFTVVPKGPLGYLSTWPSGSLQPLVSTLNAVTGTIVANAAIVPAGNGGAIDVYAQHNTDLIVDINGYFAPPGPDGLSLYNVTPCRVYDTRTPAGAPTLTNARDINVAASGCGLPATARAYAVNATVVPPGFLGYMALWPYGASQPVVSTLNALDASITSNMAVVPANNGSVCAYSAHPTELILDVSGYFAP